MTEGSDSRVFHAQGPKPEGPNPKPEGPNPKPEGPNPKPKYS